jgi:hypothetical protein
MPGYDPSILYIRHRYMGLGLCIMLEVNFREFAFYEGG